MPVYDLGCDRVHHWVVDLGECDHLFGLAVPSSGRLVEGILDRVVARGLDRTRILAFSVV